MANVVDTKQTSTQQLLAASNTKKTKIFSREKRKERQEKQKSLVWSFGVRVNASKLRTFSVGRESFPDIKAHRQGVADLR